jgi:hypothetical protein
MMETVCAMQPDRNVQARCTRSMEEDERWRVPADQAGIHRQLENYGRWARCKAATGHCSSIEWQYDSGWRETRPASSGAGPAKLDAERLFNALVRLPQRERIVLNLWYVNRRDPRRIAVKTAVSLRELPVVLRAARQMLINRLRAGA